MHRILIAFGVLSLCLQAAAEEKTAVVCNVSDDPRHHDRIACEMRLSAVLRDLGYRLLPRSFKQKAHLRVEAYCGCYHSGLANYTCDASANIYSPDFHREYIYTSSISATSDASARDEACRDLASQLRSYLGGKDQPGAGDRGTAKEKQTEQDLVVKWKGDLRPMPLLGLIKFFKDMGYQAEMVKSGAEEVRFRVTLAEPPELFRSKLETFLSAHYRIISSGEEPKLEFRIEALE